MTPLRLALQASPALAAWMLAAHLAAGACVGLAWPSAPGYLTGGLITLLGVAAGWRLALLRAAASPVGLELGEEGALAVILRGGRRLESESGARFVTRRWVVLRTGRGACPTVLVGADMLVPADFRRLRVWALWGRVPGRAAAGSPA